jgi:hypothetical protein
VIAQKFSNPRIFDGTKESIWSFGVTSDPKSNDFNSCKFVQSHLLYSDLISFVHNGQQFNVGDIVKVLSNDDEFYRIEELMYKPFTV